MTCDNGLNMNDSYVLAREIVRVLVEKQGIDVKLYDVRENCAITDFYVNVTGRSVSHVGSLSDDVQEKLSELGANATRVEGRRASNWVLLDYSDVIVNVLDKQSRDFYSLDRHFGEDALVDIGDVVDEVDEKFLIK